MAVLQSEPASIAEAAGHLKAHGLVGMPTETVYGLACDATSDRAVASLYELKERPRFNPLILHVSSLAMAETFAVFDRRARYLAQRNWPGPLTLVLPLKKGAAVSRLALAGLDTVAVRMPDHDVARKLIAAVGGPLAAPSANKSGFLSPTLAAHVQASFGPQLAIILDGGACPIGVELTIVDLTGEEPILLRPGAVSRETIAAAIGMVVSPPVGAKPTAPGMLLAHYAPHIPLRLDDRDPKPGEALLAFGAAPPQGFETMLNLSESEDLTEAAANLFAYLHELDQPPHTGIAVMRVPEKGLGVAINDRLRRAAAGSR